MTFMVGFETCMQENYTKMKRMVWLGFMHALLVANTLIESVAGLIKISWRDMMCLKSKLLRMVLYVGALK